MQHLSGINSDMYNSTIVWGDHLRLLVTRRGGMKPAVERIQSAAGELVGSRATFAKLLSVSSPAELDQTDSVRAWLLLAALNQEPAEWGVADEVLPPIYEKDRLKEMCAARDLNPEPDDSGFVSYVGESYAHLVSA